MIIRFWEFMGKKRGKGVWALCLSYYSVLMKIDERDGFEDLKLMKRVTV